MILLTIFGLLCLSLTGIDATSNTKRGVLSSSANANATHVDSIFVPEERRKCLAYGKSCHKEGESDKCCLPEGGMCHLNTDGVRVCTAPKKPTALEILIEDKLLRLGFAGAMIFDKETLKILAVRGAAHFITLKELKDMNRLLNIEKIDSVLKTKFTAAGFTFAVVGILKVVSMEGAYVSTAVQGSYDKEHNHGIYFRATPKAVVLGIHEQKEMYLGLARYFMEDVYDDMVELEKNGPLAEMRSALRKVPPLGQIGPLTDMEPSSDDSPSPEEEP